MSEVKVNKITPTTNCGTVTLGDSGDTIAIASGVTLSNSGSITNSGTITNTGTISGGTITGTIDNQVNWDTTAKTAGFTAVAGNGYFVNTTSGAITVTLPATPSAGDLVGIKDYANTANTNNITIDRNGSNIQGTANNFTISVAGTSITLIYVDGTQGWVSTGAAKASDITEQATFITATGGTVVTCGNYKIHVFTGPGTFCVSSVGNPAGGPNSADYLVIGGGGGAGQYYGGGAGAGGYRESPGSATSYTASPLGTAPATAITLTAQGYPIVVGGGGTRGPSSPGCAGSISSFSTITSAGGGGGGGGSGVGAPGNNGGSGGGAGGPSPGSGGTGNTPPVSPPQGNPGGPSGTNNSGGGGGAGSPGPAGPGPAVGANGIATQIINPANPNAPSYGFNPVMTFAGGGGGNSGPAYAAGGPGGGGGGPPAGPQWNGVVNTGSGGGADCGSGGSGIVMIRYKYQ